MKKHGLDCVLSRHLAPAAGLPARSTSRPSYARCLELGIDITSEPIPVVPAAHYTCGGVVTDLRRPHRLPGLYAVGETAYTGLHGANRLASNSLLECMVLGRAAAQRHPGRSPCHERARPLPAWDESRVTDADEEVVISHNWDELRRFMWNYVGIVRTNKRLERAQHRIAAAAGRDRRVLRATSASRRDLLELRNLVDVRRLIVRSAHAAARKPRPALQPRLSGDLAEGAADRAHAAGAQAAGKLSRAYRVQRVLHEGLNYRSDLPCTCFIVFVWTRFFHIRDLRELQLHRVNAVPRLAKVPRDVAAFEAPVRNSRVCAVLRDQRLEILGQTRHRAFTARCAQVEVEELAIEETRHVRADGMRFPQQHLAVRRFQTREFFGKRVVIRPPVFL